MPSTVAVHGVICWLRLEFTIHLSPTSKVLIFSLLSIVCLIPCESNIWLKLGRIHPMNVV